MPDFSNPAAVQALMQRLGDRIVVRDCGYQTPCWVWTRSRTTAGYGDGWFDGVHLYAHRYTYRAFHGRLPSPPFQLDHLCTNPPCCNPAHLEAVAPTVNTRRGRMAKLSLAQIAEILASSESHRLLAKRYGVAHQTIGYYKSGNYERRRRQWAA